MKIFSFNVRELGSSVKKKEVKELIQKHKIEFCCLQETKLESISDLDCKLTWGNKNCGWVFREAEGRAGGILLIWDKEVFSYLSHWHVYGALVVNGLWGHDRIECCIINVYAPCLINEKEELWNIIQNVVSQNSNCCVCVIGDFNAIRREAEREGRGVVSSNRDIFLFDGFIRNSGLIDLPLHGRSFTWYRPNGSCKSRLDRILINNTWIARWPNSNQKGLHRTLSDHVPIVLEIKVRDWGPKPFRSLNAWLLHPEFKDFVCNKWGSYNITGWGAFVVKEKFKLLKGDLKIWNQQVFGVMESKIEKLKEEIWQLDILDETFGLEEEECMRRQELMALLFRDLKLRNNILAQKSRNKWLKEGDTNSRFFHSYINRRRKRNEIVGINIEGQWLEEVEEVKQGISEFFRKHYQKRD